MPRTNMRDQFTPEQRATLKPKIICRNTFRYQDGGCTVIRLHSTDIVREVSPGRYKLDSGGWRTVTTKDRMNAYCPGGYRVNQSDGLWYVSNGRVSIPYFDGMILPDAFDKPGKGVKAEARELKLRARIKKFVRSMDKLETLPLPSQGDCWYCCMHVSAPEGDKGKTLGDATGDKSHILEHIKEGYLHGSLLVNAMRWAGYKDVGISYWLTSKRGSRSAVKSALRRYLYRQLGMVS